MRFFGEFGTGFQGFLVRILYSYWIGLEEGRKEGRKKGRRFADGNGNETKRYAIKIEGDVDRGIFVPPKKFKFTPLLRFLMT
uniref:Uncharacterized protein n=1 Tax=Caenorhabditis japonica TaxID=281687 RepID=A0A8R1IUV2_CAEJA